LRLTPYAWAKLVYLRDLGPTEVGGFGISHPEDRLLVQDICLVGQQCTGMTVEFEDAAVADYFDGQVDQARRPDEFARIWIHTHPGNSPAPSSTDEATFDRCFGLADWALMFILACGGRTYARLRLGTNPVGHLLMPVELDFSRPFPAASPEAWQAEYQRHVTLDRLMFERPAPISDPVRLTRRTQDDIPWFEDLPLHAAVASPEANYEAMPSGWEVLDG
jgi:proteasome lid subunit RPN8/RPN11